MHSEDALRGVYVLPIWSEQHDLINEADEVRLDRLCVLTLPAFNLSYQYVLPSHLASLHLFKSPTISDDCVH